MCVPHRTEANILLLEADLILSHLTANQQDMARRLPLLHFEPSSIILKLCYDKHPCYSRMSAQKMTNLSSDLLLLVKAMVTGVREMTFNKFHTESYTRSSTAFLDVCAKMDHLINRLTHSHDEFEVDEALGDLIISRDLAFSELVQGIQIALFSYEDEDRQGTAFSSVIPTTYDVEAPVRFNRLASGYFLFHFSEVIETIKGSLIRDQSDDPIDLKISQFLLSSLVEHYLSDIKARLKTGFRTVLLMGVGLCFIEVPVLASKFENGIWIMIAVVPCFTSVPQMLIRFLGNDTRR